MRLVCQVLHAEKAYLIRGFNQLFCVPNPAVFRASSVLPWCRNLRRKGRERTSATFLIPDDFRRLIQRVIIQRMAVQRIMPARTERGEGKNSEVVKIFLAYPLWVTLCFPLRQARVMDHQSCKGSVLRNFAI